MTKLYQHCSVSNIFFFLTGWQQRSMYHTASQLYGLKVHSTNTMTALEYHTCNKGWQTGSFLDNISEDISRTVTLSWKKKGTSGKTAMLWKYVHLFKVWHVNHKQRWVATKMSNTVTLLHDFRPRCLHKTANCDYNLTHKPWTSMVDRWCFLAVNHSLISTMNQKHSMLQST